MEMMFIPLLLMSKAQHASLSPLILRRQKIMVLIYCEKKAEDTILENIRTEECRPAGEQKIRIFDSEG